MGTTAQAQAGRDRARERRLKAARERRLRLDPNREARDRRIDEAVVDVEVRWEARAAAELAVVDAEHAAAAAIQRLLAENLSTKDVGRLTGLDPATVRRLRQLDIGDERPAGTRAADTDPEAGALGRQERTGFGRAASIGS